MAATEIGVGVRVPSYLNAPRLEMNAAVDAFIFEWTFATFYLIFGIPG